MLIMHVVAAIIRKDGKYLIAQRKRDGSANSLKWEFPGGKVEKNEKPEEALIREIKEELGIWIANLRHFTDVSDTTGRITISAYLADWIDGDLEPIECEDARLVDLEDALELAGFDFLDLDKKIIKKLGSDLHDA